MTICKETVLKNVLLPAIFAPVMTLPKLPESTETLCEETYGRQRRLVIRHFKSDMHELFTSREGVVGTTERALTLEEIFIAYTKGSLGPGRAYDNQPDTSVEDIKVTSGSQS